MTLAATSGSAGWAGWAAFSSCCSKSRLFFDQFLHLIIGLFDPPPPAVQLGKFHVAGILGGFHLGHQPGFVQRRLGVAGEILVAFELVGPQVENLLRHLVLLDLLLQSLLFVGELTLGENHLAAKRRIIRSEVRGNQGADAEIAVGIDSSKIGRPNGPGGIEGGVVVAQAGRVELVGSHIFGGAVLGILFGTRTQWEEPWLAAGPVGPPALVVLVREQRERGSQALRPAQIVRDERAGALALQNKLAFDLRPIIAPPEHRLVKLLLQLLQAGFFFREFGLVVFNLLFEMVHLFDPTIADIIGFSRQHGSGQCPQSNHPDEYVTEYVHS